MKRPVIILLSAAAIGALFGWTSEASLVFLIPFFLITLIANGEKKTLALLGSVVLLLTVLHARQLKEPSRTEMSLGTTSEMTAVITAQKNPTSYTKPYIATLWDGPLAGDTVLLQTQASQTDLRVGQAIRGTGEVRRADRTQNDGLFSYGDYVKRNGWDGIVHMRDGYTDLGLAPDLTLTLRRTFLEGIDRALNELFDQPSAQLMLTVLTARSSMEQETKDEFRALGITHLLAVSGLHAGILFGLTVGVGGLWLHKRNARIVALILLCIYAWIIGFPISVVRALIMAFVLVMARSLQKPYDALTALFFAVMLILVLFPGSVVDAGFHLSVMGVWSVIWVARVIAKRYPAKSFLGALLQQAAAIHIGILPLILYHFGESPVIGILANLILVPVFGLAVSAVIPVLLLYFVLPQAALAIAWIPAALIDAFLLLTGALSAVPAPAIRTGGFGVAHVLWSYLLLYIALRPQLLTALPYHLRRGSVIAACGALIAAPLLAASHPTTVLFIDVGQGDAILLKDGGYSFMIDTGGEGREGMSDSFASIVQPSLAREGVRHLDGVFISHFDADHSENLHALIESVPTDVIMIPAGLAETDDARALLNGNVPVIALKSGDRLPLPGGHAIDVLYAAERREPNDSLVLRYQVGGTSFLFTGDLEENAERQILDRSLQSDIIKVGHHGSATSTSPAFLDAVQPKTAIISAGYGNTFGHPHIEVLERLTDRGIEPYRTDSLGNLRVEITQEGYRITGYPSMRRDPVVLMVSMIGWIPIAGWVIREGRRTKSAAYRLSEKTVATGDIGTIYTLWQ